MISEETSKRITSLRFLLAVFVVFIHNTISQEMAVENSYVYNNSTTGVWIQNIIAFFTASAVPLFLLFAGYLQVKKSDSYRTLVRKKIRSFLIPYILWIALYLFYETLIRSWFAQAVPSLISDHNNVYKFWSVKDYFFHILGYSSEQGGVPLAAGQFWFVRNLFIFVLLSPLFVFLVKKVPFFVFILISAIFSSVNIVCEANLPYSLFYYICGLYWSVYDFDLFEKIDRIKWYEIGLCFVLVFLLKFFHYQLPCSFALTTLFSSLIILKFSGVIVKNNTIFEKTKYLSDFSFFLYAIHMPVLNVIVQKIWLRVFPMKNAFFCLFQFFGGTIIIVVIGTCIGIILRKICPPLFSLLNGGRK